MDEIYQKKLISRLNWLWALSSVKIGKLSYFIIPTGLDPQHFKEAETKSDQQLKMHTMGPVCKVDRILPCLFNLVDEWRPCAGSQFCQLVTPFQMRVHKLMKLLGWAQNLRSIMLESTMVPEAIVVGVDEIKLCLFLLVGTSKVSLLLKVVWKLQKIKIYISAMIV